jgi:CDP-glycerol glycerophosphotransferase (TagB/SpsB family)
LLRYSDVMVNYFSTISLEAAICDLPVIHAGYDTYTFGQRFSVTTGFLQRQTHNRRKLRLAASKVAKSEMELIRSIDEYLSDRTLDQNARREYAVSECGELDGQAGVRLVNMIKSRL